jgi:chromosome segregation ATPase
MNAPQSEAMKTIIGLRNERDELCDEIERLQEMWLRISKRQEAEIEQLRVGNEKLKTELWHLQAVNGALKVTLRRLIADYQDVPDPTDTDGQAVFEDARRALGEKP